MKDFWEDLGRRIGETAETVTSKAGDAIEIQRLRAQMRGLARENAVDMIDLGRTIYDRYKAGGEIEENAKGICDAIKDREASIKEYEKKIAKIKGASECSKCGKMVGKDMIFCPYCGEKAAREETAGEAEEETGAEDEAGDTADRVKEKVADAAETVAEKAEKAAKKVGEMADKAAQKTEKMAEKAAEKTGKTAGKVAEKLSETAEKVSEKINEK